MSRDLWNWPGASTPGLTSLLEEELESKKFFTWRWAVIHSDLPSTTKHLLLTISCHMNDGGEGCFPSTKLLAENTSLSERCVCEHIDNAKQLGWITVSRHGFAGKKWAHNEYHISWPEGTDVGSVPKTEGTDFHAEGTDPDDKKALTQGQSNSKGVTLKDNSKVSEDEEEELNLQMPSFARWAEKVFREAGLKWVKPKYPDSFYRLDQVPARSDMLAYVKDGGTNFFEWYDRYKAQGDVWKPKPTNGNGKVYKSKQEQEADEDAYVMAEMARLAEKEKEDERLKQERIRERKAERIRRGYYD